MRIFVLRLRFVVFQELLLTVSTGFRQVCKRCPFTVRKAAFYKLKGHVSCAERMLFETVNTVMLFQNNSANGLILQI